MRSCSRLRTTVIRNLYIITCRLGHLQMRATGWLSWLQVQAGAAFACMRRWNRSASLSADCTSCPGVQVCDEWFRRMRMPLLHLASAAGLPEHAAAHGQAAVADMGMALASLLAAQRARQQQAPAAAAPPLSSHGAGARGTPSRHCIASNQPQVCIGVYISCWLPTKRDSSRYPQPRRRRCCRMAQVRLAHDSTSTVAKECSRSVTAVADQCRYDRHKLEEPPSTHKCT